MTSQRNRLSLGLPKPSLPKDISLLADEDVVYYNGYNDIITNAYQKISDADMILFALDFESERQSKDIPKVKRLRLYNALKFGAVNISFLNDKLKKNQISFNEMFGGGSEFVSGEDSLFLLDCLKNKMKIYVYPEKIGRVKDTNSTWYQGVNDEFLQSKGAFISAAFKMAKYPLLVYFSIKFTFKYSLKFSYVLKHLWVGNSYP